MKEHQIAVTRELLSFIAACPTPFQVVDECERRLLAAGFQALSEGQAWNLTPGEGYFTTRNRSAILAFRVPMGKPDGFMISATHTDSPTFRLKPNAENVSGADLRLDTERYGGMIYSSWFDRPLSIAGRLAVRDHGKIRTVSVMPDRDLALIPNVAIHFNRTVNEGYRYNPASDLYPLIGEASDRGALLGILAASAGVSLEDVISYDLSLYDRTPGKIWGVSDAFFSSPRIDNLQCTYATLSGFLGASANERAVPVFCAFDNEETGSMTRQGAASGFLQDALGRISAYGKRPLEELLASSLLVSADNGHARHPNHAELSDALNAPEMNLGVVIKRNASQKYATDAVSEAIFTEICRSANVPVQVFCNRSDLPGGSTLGSIATSHTAVCTVDIGLAQLAMHSAYETAGCADTAYLIDAMKKLFSLSISMERDGEYRISGL